MPRERPLHDMLVLKQVADIIVDKRYTYLTHINIDEFKKMNSNYI